MKIILIADVEKLGKKGEAKEVSAGYAKNFLLPKKLAVLATSVSLKQAEDVKKKEATKLESEEKRNKELQAKLKELKLSIKKKANEEGVLFGAVGEEEIAKLINLNISSKDIKTQTPIKALGEFNIEVLGVKVKLLVEKE